MRHLVIIACIASVLSAAGADIVTERWGPDKATFTPADGGGVVAVFDLSALPRNAKIYRARLLAHVPIDGFPRDEPILVQALTAPHEPGKPPAVEAKAMELVPPRFVTFDAGDVVRRWVSKKLANHGLLIRGGRVDPGRTFLEITYEGRLSDPPPAVTGLKAFWRAGQVFLTWQEVNSKFAGRDEVTWGEYKKEVDRIRAGRGPITTYRIYRHSRPITARTLAEAELLDEVGQYSCFDERMVQTEWKGERIKNVKVDDARVPRTAVEPMTELPCGTGVWVRTTDKPGRHYYAVIAAVNGVENTTRIDDGCATGQPLDEKVAPTEPILLHEVGMQYQRERVVFCYIWWVDPPLNHLPDFIHVGVSAGPQMGNPPAVTATAEQAKEIEPLVDRLGAEDAAVRQAAEEALIRIGPPAAAALEQAQQKPPAAWGVVPKLPADAGEAEKAKAQAIKDRIDDARRGAARTLVKIRVRCRDQAGEAPLLVHGYWWSGGWNSVHPCPQPDGVTLAIDDHPWQVRGIHDGNGTLKAWSQGKVQEFYVRKVKALLPWVRAGYRTDVDRIYAFSGGWAWHHPEIFAATFEVLSMNPKRSPAMPEVRRYWGDPKTPPPTEWGMSPYEYWNTGEWVRTHPAEELAFLSYTPYQHLGDFGRIDKPAFFAAMRDTKHAFTCTFDEGRGWYGMANPDWVFEIRRSDSIPAFTGCTLDDNPGIGLGWDPGGKLNYYLCAEPRTQVDSPDRWEMTVYLYRGDRYGRDAAPVDRCTVDVTPRRCRQFKAAPGEKCTWTNLQFPPPAKKGKDSPDTPPPPEPKPIQTGTAVADGHGLVTAEGVLVTKDRNRLIIERAR